MLEMDKVTPLLQEIALKHGPIKPDDAYRNFAIVLMHLAESIERIERGVRRLQP